MRRASRALSFALCLAAGALAGPPSGRAQPPDRAAAAQAGEHFDRGIEFFNEGRFDAALAEFRRAYELAPAYQVLYNLGRVHAELGHAVEASDAYRRFLEEGGRQIPAAQRREVEAALRQQLARIARIQVTANVEGAVVSVDGVDVAQTPLAEPLRLSAGNHTVGVSAPGYESVTRGVQIAGGVEETLSVELRRVVERMGTLRISSSVPDVVVTIDDRAVGTTPLGMTVPVSEGNHLVVGTRPGYEPAREWVSVPHQAEVEVHLPMRRSASPRAGEVGVVQLSIPRAPYVLTVDGEQMMANEARLELPVGTHHLEIEVADRLPYATDIEVVADRPVQVVLLLLWVPEVEADLMADARHRRRLGMGLTFSGVGLLGASAGVFAWITNEMEQTDAEVLELLAVCPMRPCTDPADEARAEELVDQQKRENAVRGVALATGALGLVGAVTGFVLWVSAPSESEIEASARAGVRLELLPGALQLRGTF